MNDGSSSAETFGMVRKNFLLSGERSVDDNVKTVLPVLLGRLGIPEETESRSLFEKSAVSIIAGGLKKVGDDFGIDGEGKQFTAVNREGEKVERTSFYHDLSHTVETILNWQDLFDGCKDAGIIPGFKPEGEKERKALYSTVQETQLKRYRIFGAAVMSSHDTVQDKGSGGNEEESWKFLDSLIQGSGLEGSFCDAGESVIMRGGLLATKVVNWDSLKQNVTEMKGSIEEWFQGMCADADLLYFLLQGKHPILGRGQFEASSRYFFELGNSMDYKSIVGWFTNQSQYIREHEFHLVPKVNEYLPSHITSGKEENIRLNEALLNELAKDNWKQAAPAALRPFVTTNSQEADIIRKRFLTRSPAQ